MDHFPPKIAWISILSAALIATFQPTPLNAQKAQIQHVAIHKANGSTEIEIQTSRRVVPLTQIVTDPERLVIDFPDAVPGPQLRSLSGNHGDVKGVRTGLFQANPPITRVVLELQSTQDFKLVPSNKSVTVRLGSNEVAAASSEAGPASSASMPAVTPVPAPSTATLAPARMSASAAPPTPAPVSLPTSVPARARPKPVPEISDEPAVRPGQTAQVRHVTLLKVGGAIEIEIEASQRIVPAVQFVTG